MNKKTLNLSIEESIKRRAKRIAKQRGISVSRFFEKLVAEQEDPEEFTPTSGSAAEQIMNAIPESKKVDDYDYDKVKYEALKEKYDFD
jgi:antitoxin component of RelBE/YafQ-DinJ toxin-antitoxin module